MDELDFLDIIETPLIDGGDFLQLLLRFGFNFLVTGIIIHLFYYEQKVFKCNPVRCLNGDLDRNICIL